MHCVSCGYELVGLPPGPCPECSHPFDPDDPATWTGHPIPTWRRIVSSRWSGYVATTLAIVVAMWWTILPRPFIAWNGMMDPLLWLWFDRPFGVERQRALPEQLELSWWNGTLTGVLLRRIEPSAPSAGLKVAWDIRRRADQWNLNVLQRNVRLDSVLVAYNSMRRDDELFGLRLDTSNRSDAPGAALDTFNVEPFKVSGRQEDVLAAILVAYDVSVIPMLITSEDTDLWIFEKESGRLVRITVEEADARGIQYTVVDGIGVRRHRFNQ